MPLFPLIVAIAFGALVAFGSGLPITLPFVSCFQDAATCPDGTMVGRNPALGCQFDPCPGSFCSWGVKECPDGSAVKRNPLLGCQFDPCLAGLQPECLLTPDPGPCEAAFQKFYFDPAAGRCEWFTWGGCQGTAPFDTLEGCLEACGGPDPVVSCQQDADCVKVSADCCSCSNGGQAKAVSKGWAPVEDASSKTACSQVACPAVISDHPSCLAEAKCVAGVCVLV